MWKERWLMPSLYDKYPFLMNYFRNGLTDSSKSRISHCLLFFGSDANVQYELALEIARLLNCTGDKSENCDCLNCRWIKENKHPAVITVSKVDFKPDDDKSKTVISIAQTREIKNMLAVTSDYHRVIIFCDRDENGNICGINEKVFQEEAANSLLKTFEEPPANTTFIFITKDKTDMISTIVSRSQCFFVPSQIEENRGFSQVQNAMSIYLKGDKNLLFDFKDNLTELAKETNAQEVLNEVENYLLSMLKENFSSPVSRVKLLQDLKSTELAKRQLELGMQNTNVFDNLAFALFEI